MDVNSLSRTKWNCKYHIMFAPKFRRKVVYGGLKQDIANKKSSWGLWQVNDVAAGKPFRWVFRLQSQ